MARPAVDEMKRFLAFVKKTDSGCHEWQGHRTPLGYGRFAFRGRQEGAHRVAYLLLKGSIPRDKWVLHKCDNPKCVNPEHLYLGTPKDNCRDRQERSIWHRNIEYSADEIAAFQALFAAGLSQTAISRMVGIRQSSISRFIRGQYVPR